MDFLTTTEFQSKIDPGVKVTLRVVTMGRRIDFIRKQRAIGTDDLESIRTVWEVLVKDFEGLTIDGKKPSVIDFFLNGPEDLVNEISAELQRNITPIGSNDAGDETVITIARQQIMDAELRISARKNSEPQSSGSSPDPGTPTAGNAHSTEPSGSDEIAMAAPI